MASGTSETWDSQGTAFPLRTAERLGLQVLGIEVEFGRAAEWGRVAAEWRPSGGLAAG
ncbi:hypothetical protein [Streptomyces sp. NPDC006463]|uniref:hypothetical protein n=1 Tax=Streptomyces sp. NPDC006463 TaxID=3364746 RepID=UPI0036CC4581